MPPTYSGSASRMVTGTFSLLSRYPAVRPAGPAPIMATDSGWIMGRIPLEGVRDGFQQGTYFLTIVNVNPAIRGRIETGKLFFEDGIVQLGLGTQTFQVRDGRARAFDVVVEKLAHAPLAAFVEKFLDLTEALDLERPDDQGPALSLHGRLPAEHAADGLQPIEVAVGSELDPDIFDPAIGAVHSEPFGR